MALDDPIVWVLIVALVIFMFGSGKIPQFARALGEARKEFDNAMRGISQPSDASPSQSRNVTPPGAATGPSSFSPTPSTKPANDSDPLVIAAKREGIDTQGKARDQIATELALKLNDKKKEAGEEEQQP